MKKPFPTIEPHSINKEMCRCQVNTCKNIAMDFFATSYLYFFEHMIMYLDYQELGRKNCEVW